MTGLASFAKYCRAMSERPVECPCGLPWLQCAIHLWDGEPPNERDRRLWKQLADEIDAHMAGETT